MEKEKEKIGMEKLIELLNEYKKIKGYDGNTKITNYDTDTGSFTNGYSGLEYEIVIGKRYGFIKWLVEGGKIHWESIPAIIKVDGYLADGSDTEYYNMEESLLMLLSISDTPIEDLISYLR